MAARMPLRDCCGRFTKSYRLRLIPSHADLRRFCTEPKNHRRAMNTWISFFTVQSWSGTPSIGEPDKCTELVWVDRDVLPVDIVDYVGAALRAISARESLVLYGWK